MGERPIDMAIEILRATRDGDDLAPHHLSLVQSAVNGWLTEAGEIAFYELYRNVQEGYVVPWFHGIEHLTYDHEGFVYWKGHQVEHYNPGYAYSEKARMGAEEVARRCQILEVSGEPVNTTTVIWKWEDEKLPEEVVA